MGQIKWYKRDPDAALNGMMELTLEQRGAYNTVLDLIYTRDGNLTDDDRFIAGWLRVDVRVWKRIKQHLIDVGKLYISDGLLRNSRADVEVLSALHRVGSARDAGKASGRARSYKSEYQSPQNNHLARTDVPTECERTFELTTTTTTKRVDASASPLADAIEIEPVEVEPDLPPPPPPPPTKPKRAMKTKRAVGVDHPLPDDWAPVLGEKAQAIVDAWPKGMLDREEFAFRNHAATHGRLAVNWDAAFRTWIGKADERRTGNGSQAPRRNPAWSGGARDTRDAYQRRLDDRLLGDDPGYDGIPAGPPE